MPAATPFVVIRRLIPALLVLFITGPARADEAAVEDGLFITVANPITSGVTNRVKEMTERARQRKTAASRGSSTTSTPTAARPVAPTSARAWTWPNTSATCTT